MKCKCGNESSIRFGNFQQGKRCNLCKNKTEKKLFSWLQEHNFNVEIQVKFYWCKKNKNYHMILYIKLLLELDGPQHFRQIRNWKSPEEIKNKSALENRYRIIQICQEIVYSDKENWDNQLLKAIKSKEKLIKIGNIYSQKY